MTPNDWLRARRGAARRGVRAVVWLGTASGILLLVQAGLFAVVADNAIFGKANLGQIVGPLAALPAVFLVRAALRWFSERMAFVAGANVRREARRALLENLHALGPVRLYGERGGELANTLTDGVEALEAYYARYLPQLYLAVFVPLAILVVVFPVDWISGLVFAVTAPLIPAFMILIGKGAESLNQRQWRRMARLSAHFLDTIQGLTTLKLFDASRREARMVELLSEDYRKSTMKVLRMAFLSSLALEFLATLSIALVAVLIGFRLLWGDIGFREGFLVLLLAPEFYLPLRAMGTHYHARMEAIGAAERMVELLDTTVPRVPAAQVTPPPRPWHVRLENVGFSYEPGRPALYDLSLEIGPGERLAVVGATGAGKSTLINLLLGFVRPDSGRVLVNGLDLCSIDRDAWFRQVAWVPQRPHLFHGTILDNLLLGMPDLPLAAVKQATRQALADEFIESLPLGYDTPIGERGYGLSGGQVQRLALARAFLRDASLVVLDEPGASLDGDSEAKLTKAVDRLSEGRTLVMVAHRLGSVRSADNIVVLRDGRIAECGDHQALLRRRGLYANLVSLYGGAS